MILQFLPQVGAPEMGNLIVFRKDLEDLPGPDHAGLLATSGESYSRPGR